MMLKRCWNSFELVICKGWIDWSLYSRIELVDESYYQKVQIKPTQVKDELLKLHLFLEIFYFLRLRPILGIFDTLIFAIKSR